MLCYRREDNVQDMLHCVTCLDTFESIDIQTFRLNLTESLRKRVLAGNALGAIPLHQLLGEIPWSELCKAHDRIANDRTYSSPLEEVLRIVCNSAVVPSAYAAHVLSGFFHIMILGKQEPRGWRPSELVLLDSMVMLSKRVPSFFIQPILELYQKLAMKPSAGDNLCQHHVDSDRLSKYLSVLSELYRRSGDLWFKSSSLSLLLNMVRDIDDYDVEFLQEPLSPMLSLDASMCLKCQKKIIPLTMPTIRRRGTSLLRILDDEGVVEKLGKPPAGSISTGQECRCTQSEQTPLAHALHFTRLPFKLVILRSHVYRAILEVMSLTRVHQGKCPTLFREFGLHRGQVIALSKIVDMACESAYSSSLRLSIMIVADSIGPKAFDYVTQRLWKKIDAGRRNHDILRMWSELIVESSNFDDPLLCWSGLEPLFTRILCYCDHNLHHVHQINVTTYHLLRSLSFVLSRRRPALKAKDDTIKVQFRDFVKRVSASFGELKFWISTEMDSAEVEEIKITLQNVGIFTNNCGEARGSMSEMSQWPFPSNHGVRAAYQRMGPHVCRNRLISTPENVNEEQRIQSLSEQESEYQHVQCSRTAMLTYLNDDTLGTIFSFLAPLDLVKVGRLCKTFRLLASDDFQWMNSYRSAFGILGHDVEKTISKIGSWRNLFVEKYYSEKALKFKYSPSGWKHRTCGYIGCYQVMRSAQQQSKHHQVHEDRYARRVAQAETKRRREAERNSRKKEKKTAEPRKRKREV